MQKSSRSKYLSILGAILFVLVFYLVRGELPNRRNLIYTDYFKGLTPTTHSTVVFSRVALDRFKTDCKRFPTSEEGWAVLVDKAKLEPWCDKWGPISYLEKEPLDEWGRPLIFEVIDQYRVTVRSLGADGREGGVGADADISSE